MNEKVITMLEEKSDKKDEDNQSAPQPEDKYAPVKLVAVEMEQGYVRTQRTLEKV